MKSRTLVTVLLSLQILHIAILFTTAEDDSTTSVTQPTDNSLDEHKLLHECQHSDYRTYIKCLKRQKRHHAEDGETRHCMDECDTDCESTRCAHDCHKRCLKKTKEIRHVITEYEWKCDDVNGCNNSSTGHNKNILPATNITTNIDINNVIHNHQTNPDDSSNGTKTKPGQNPPGRPDGPTTRPCTGAWCGPFGSGLIPQISLVPQVTFGFRGWPFPQPPAPSVDCAPCDNPLLRYRCDVNCYNPQGP